MITALPSIRMEFGLHVVYTPAESSTTNSEGEKSRTIDACEYALYSTQKEGKIHREWTSLGALMS